MGTNNKNNVVSDSLIFPTRHLPKCFSNRELYNRLDEIFNKYGSIEKILKDNFELDGNKIKEFKGYKNSIYGLKKGTEPIEFYIAKPSGANRVISIVNPLVLIPLHFYINKYHNEILAEQLETLNCYDSSSRYSYEEGTFVLYFDYDGDAVYVDYENVTQQNFQYNLLNKQKICDGKYYHLSVDINNFFNSIYTHTISWDLVNQEHKEIFDNLDILTRTLNNNETKGIVIGPYTSSLFSEIILSKVDRKIINECMVNDISYVRFCDDYDFYSDSKEKLENDIRLLISENLSKFKLDLNMSKMKLEEFPFISLNTIQNKNLFVLIKRIQENDYESELELVEDIMNEINNSIKIKYSNCNYLLKILSSQIKKEIIKKENFTEETGEILLDFLINMSFKQNMISTDAFNLILELFNLLELDNERIITKWIKKRNSRISHIKEITDVWLIFLIIKLNICNKAIDNYILNIMEKSDICSILVFEYLYKNNLLNTYKERIKKYLLDIKENMTYSYEHQWKSALYYSKYWLLFYTNCVRWKIHKKAGFKDTILKEANLEELVKTPELKEKLNLFKIMLDCGIELIDFNL